MNNKTGTVALGTIGCKLNQAETEQLSRQLAQSGYRLVPASEKADIYILNTCTVTHIADRKCRNWLRQVHIRNPEARVIATGCYANRAPRELKKIDGISYVLSSKEPHSKLWGIMGKGAPPQGTDEAAFLPPASWGVSSGDFYEQKIDLVNVLGEGHHTGGEPNLSGALASRTRAFIKIQEGCRNFCAYCIVPLVRGAEKNLPVETILAKVGQRVNEGCKEIVITGTEIGSYSYDGVNLRSLLERILQETDVTRLRLSSLQPAEIMPEMVGLWQDKRLCRHFHIALQSGSDKVLKRMNRGYTTGDYERAVCLIKQSIPEAALTTDVIVGFPGETETEFEESYHFCERLGFSRIHVFPYSPRPGTRAADMKPQVPGQVKKQRRERMLDLAKASARNFRQRFQGQTMPVLWEQSQAGVWSGLTDNYIRVYARSERDLTNQILPAEFIRLKADGVEGLLD